MHTRIHYILTLFIVFILLFVTTPTAHAEYSASDVLGQLQSGVPNFTTNNADNFTQPNDQGYNYTEGMALDTVNHQLFVSDDQNNRVLEYNLNTNNTLIHHYADHVLGQSDFISGQVNQGGSVSSTTMNNPVGLSYDSSSNRLFVADINNNRILVFNLSGGITNDMPASYVLGQLDFISGQGNQGGSVASTTMGNPAAMSYDSPSQQLIVIDESNHRVLVFNLSGGITNDMPASYVLGQPDFVSRLINQGGSVASTTMKSPYAITYDQPGKRLFVDDDGNYRVLVFNLSGGITNDMPASNVIGQPDLISTNWLNASSTAVGYPEELAYDSNHQRLFVGDDGSNRLLSFNLSGGITNGMAASNVIGAPDFNTAEPGPGSCVVSQTAICDPEIGMAYDTTNDHLWMSDDSNNRVLVFDMSEGISNNMPASDVLGQIDGNGAIDFNSNTADHMDTPNEIGINYPFGIALDTVAHRLFVTDENNSRVLEYNLDSNNNLIHYYADHVLGQPDFISGQQNQCACSTSASTTMADPDGLAYDSSVQRLFVTDGHNNRILVFNLSGGITNDMPASYVIGQSDFVSDFSNQGGSVASTTMFEPITVSYDEPLKRLFVDDFENNRVLVFNLASSITNGMPASYVLGQTGFVSNDENQGGGAASTTMDNPYTLTYDQSDQRLFVADDNNTNHRVLVFNLSHGITNDMPASNVIGQPDFVSTNWYNASSTAVGAPEELAYDSNHDRLFVGDDANYRLLSFDLSGGITNGMAASAVIGAPDFNTSEASSPCGVSTTAICDPEVGMAYDTANNRLWMTDDSNNRVLSFNFITSSSTIPATAFVGTAYSSTPASAANYQGVLSYSITSGSLPSGITLNRSTGALSGTPTTNGTYAFTLTATDSNGSQGSFTDFHTYTITVSGGSTSSSTSSTPPPSNGAPSGSFGELGRAVSIPSLVVPTLPPVARITASLTSSQLTALITLLQSFNTDPSIISKVKASFSLPPPPTPTFTTNLSLGSVSPQVTSLQRYLNTHGYEVTSSGPGSLGSESSHFGHATEAALIKFQKANHITPALGYFGVKTRAVVENTQ